MRWLLVVATTVACGGPTTSPRPPDDPENDTPEKPAWTPKAVCVDLHGKDIDELESATAAEVIELSAAHAELLAATLDADDPPEIIEAIRIREFVAALVSVCPDGSKCTARLVAAVGSYDPAATADDDDDPGPPTFDVRANIELPGADADSSAIDIGDFDHDSHYELVLMRGTRTAGSTLELYAFPALQRLWRRPEANASCDQAVIGWKDVNCDGELDLLVELECAISEDEVKVTREAWSLSPSRETYAIAGSEDVTMPASKQGSIAVTSQTGCTGTWAFEVVGQAGEPGCEGAKANVEFLLAGRSATSATYRVLSGSPGKPTVLQAARVAGDCFAKVSYGNTDPNARAIDDYRLNLRLKRKKIIGDGWYTFQRKRAPKGISQVCNVVIEGSLR